MQLNKKKTLAIMTILTIGIIFLITEGVYARGNGQGRKVVSDSQQLRNGTGIRLNAEKNMIDENNNGIADGQEDFDGDGVLNRDDEDYEKNYVNMRDDDGDGVPNKDDEDYKRPLDGSGRPETAGRGNVNRSEIMGQGQGRGQELRNNGPAKSQQNRARVNSPSVGQQIREMIQLEDQTQENLIQDVEQIRQTSGFKRFFFGADRDVINNVESRLEQRERRINDLKSMLNEIDDPVSRESLEQQITKMEEVTTTLRQKVRKERGGILNWFVSLFN